MRKKILSILLSGALVLSSMVFASAQEDGAGTAAQTQALAQQFRVPQDVAENKIETAVAVGVGLLEVKDNKFRPTEVITNEEAAAAVAKLYGLTPADTSRIHIYYPDLDAANANAGMIMALINAKLLSPNGVIPFNAVQPVDFDWFSKMLIDYTGFGALAPIRNGYARLINETGIGKGVADRAALTRSEAAVMLYRTLDTRALEISSIYAGNEFDYKQTDETFLESEYHLYKETGRVAQNGYSTIAAPQSDLNKNTVVIEEKGIYKMADELAIPYLGYDIDYLCYQPEGEMGEIIYAAPAEDDFLVTTLNLADVSYSGGVLEHSDENGKVTKYKVKDNAPTLLNGVAGGSLNLIGQDGVNGSITLIDYDANKSADVLLFMVYESSVVKSINKNENSMKLENGVTVEPDSDTVATFIYKDGALVTDVTKIAAKSMATVYTSKNGKVRKVIITEETVSGVVTKKGKDYVEINGQILKPASQAVMDQMTVGDNVKVNLSADGLITKVELLGKSGFKYGFLVYIGADSGFGSTGGGMKLFTEDGKMETLRFSEGFSLNGSKTNSKGNAITVADVTAKLRENGSVNQLIRYYLAEDGTVKRIDVYYNNTAENGGTGYDIANFSLDYNKETMLYGTFVAGKHTLRSDSIAFVVPDSNIENAKSDQFAVGNWASIIGTGAGYGQDEKYMMTMFDADEGFGAKVVVVTKNANPKLTNYQRLAVVADVEYGVDYEGEEATVLSMMINNEKTPVVVKNSEQNLITADFTKPRTEGTQGELGNVTIPGINQKDLTVGDVIEYQVDNNGEMCDIVIYARMDSINRGLGYISHDRVEADGGYYTFNGTRPNIVGFGRVTGAYGENTFLNVGNLSIDDVARTHTIKLGGNCYVVDTKRGKVTVGSLGDVDTGDIIVTRSHIRDMWEVVVFKQ